MARSWNRYGVLVHVVVVRFLSLARDLNLTFKSIKRRLSVCNANLQSGCCVPTGHPEEPFPTVSYMD